MHADKVRSRFLRDGRERPQETFWADRPLKSGVAPAQSGDCFCVTFLILVSFISSISRNLSTSQREEGGEDEAEVRDSYLLHLLCRRFSPRTEGDFLLGWSDPGGQFGHGTVCESGVAPAQHGVLPAPKLIVAPCATSCSSGTCSIGEVTGRVTQMVIRVFPAPVTSYAEESD
jgi:hypothetical protein